MNIENQEVYYFDCSNYEVSVKIIKVIKCEKCNETVEVTEVLNNIDDFIKNSSCTFCKKFLCNHCTFYKINHPFEYPFCSDCETKSLKFFNEKIKQRIIKK